MAALTSTALRERYIDLLMGCLTRELFLDEEAHDVDLDEWPGDREELLTTLRANGWRIMRRGGDPAKRDDGNDWPPAAETMVGRQRLADVRHCVSQVLSDDVPGDLIETGVWRGGVTILMRGILEAWGDTGRRVVFEVEEGVQPRPVNLSLVSDRNRAARGGSEIRQAGEAGAVAEQPFEAAEAEPEPGSPAIAMRMSNWSLQT